MKRIAITGGSGFIGLAFVSFLKGKGYEPKIISRQKDRGIFWDPKTGEIDRKALESVDCVVHLAGENIGSLRWSQDKKRRIQESRLKGLDLLLSTKKELVVASAVGYFGDRADEILTASSPPGSGFLSELCQSVEAKAKGSSICRFGLVLSPKGGILHRLLPLVRCGLGAILGGDQYMSWITLDDLMHQLLFAIENPSQQPLNCCSPNPVRHKEFMHTLAQTLHRPLVFKLPKGLVRLMLGEASQLLLNSSRAVPSEEQLPLFEHPDLGEALHYLL